MALSVSLLKTLQAFAVTEEIQTDADLSAISLTPGHFFGFRVQTGSP